MDKTCDTCEHENIARGNLPCDKCLFKNLWEPKKIASKNDLSLISKAIFSGPDSRSPRSYFNTPCLACKVIEHEMIRLGALIFCWKCFQINFLVLMFFNPEEFDENYKNGWRS